MESFPCADCDKTFENAPARNRHRWSQHAQIPPISVGGKQYAVEREEDGTLRCPVHQCGRSYTSRQAFAKHAKIAHGPVSEPPVPSPGPADSSSQELSFGPPGSESRPLLHLLRLQPIDPSPDCKVPKPSADSAGEGPAPGVTSIPCNPSPGVFLHLPEVGENILLGS